MPKPFPILEPTSAARPAGRRDASRVARPRPRADADAADGQTAGLSRSPGRWAGANYIPRMILDRFLVTDQVAIVTASGRGIGAAVGDRALAEAGADVVLAARTEDQLRDVAVQVEAAGRRAVVVPGDLTDFDLIASLAETAVNEFGRLDIVVNNMGGTMPRPLLDTSPRFLEEAFRFNVSAGHALASRRAAHARGRPPRRRHRLHLLGHGPRGRPWLPRLRHRQGRARAVHPSGLTRPGTARSRVNAIGVGSTATSALDIVMSSDELRTAMEDATPLRRLGHVDDIASAILYLALARRRLCHGQDHRGGRRPSVAQPRFPLPDL